MKKIFALAVLAISCGAYADTTSGSSSGPNSQTTTTTSTGQAAANNAGNAQSITFTSPDQTTTVVKGGTDSSLHETVSGTQTIKNTPSVSGPPLVSSNDTCMGSASGGVNVPGFGLSLGKTYTDPNCVMLKNSREMWNMGMKAAALAILCNDPMNKEALEITGFECPQTTRARKEREASAAQPVQQPQYTDPIVRARLGLPPLATK